ncbi:MAG: 3' terminal RNA ribose 2'-O-methyltransferase Hen1 [Alphaproteobacteria bacterium]|nr:3' terminal RNA ribose 2'-O-methyltransferase Hen1 [Alphaproteobacteria bacterium]
MQLELTLTGRAGDFSARDLGFLLHKHPDHVHKRQVAVGDAYVFFTESGDERTTVVLAIDVDPVALVRGRSPGDRGLLTQYVNDRPYAASSFLSVAISKSFGQSMSGRSKERQDLAERKLDFEARVVPVALTGDLDVAHRLFEPLGYKVVTDLLPVSLDANERRYASLTLCSEVRLADLLNHIYVLLPVLDNAKHWWIDEAEVANLLAKGEGWLEGHPEKEFIARRALKHRRGLANMALARLKEAEASEDAPDEEEQAAEKQQQSEGALEKPIRLHELRLDTVAGVLRANNAASVLDLGCGEGKLMARLIKERGIRRIVGVDASIATLERAARRLYLDRAGETMRERVQLLQGSLTYADRRLEGFDAAALVEVIEHIDPPRLSALASAVFGVAKPNLVVVTTPNREYNALFEAMPAGTLRHPDHRFEWTRAEFADWSQGVAQMFAYTVEFSPLGPVDEAHGPPSQMAVFKRGAK